METVTVIAGKEVKTFTLNKGGSLADGIKSFYVKLLAVGIFKATAFQVYCEGILVSPKNFDLLNWAGKTLEIKPPF